MPPRRNGDAPAPARGARHTTPCRGVERSAVRTPPPPAGPQQYSAVTSRSRRSAVRSARRVLERRRAVARRGLHPAPDRRASGRRRRRTRWPRRSGRHAAWAQASARRVAQHLGGEPGAVLGAGDRRTRSRPRRASRSRWHRRSTFSVAGRGCPRTPLQAHPRRGRRSLHRRPGSQVGHHVGRQVGGRDRAPRRAAVPSRCGHRCRPPVPGGLA